MPNCRRSALIVPRQFIPGSDLSANVSISVVMQYVIRCRPSRMSAPSASRILSSVCHGLLGPDSSPPPPHPTPPTTTPNPYPYPLVALLVLSVLCPAEAVRLSISLTLPFRQVFSANVIGSCGVFVPQAAIMTGSRVQRRCQ